MLLPVDLVIYARTMTWVFRRDCINCGKSNHVNNDGELEPGSDIELVSTKGLLFRKWVVRLSTCMILDDHERG